MYKFVLAAAAALVVGASGAAHATTTVYTLDQDLCSNACGSPAGTVDVTPNSTGDDLHVVVTLNSGFKFNSNGNGFDTLTFSLAGDPTVSFTGLPSDWAADSSNPGDIHQDGSGYWDYGIIAGDNTTTSLDFHITGASPLTLIPSFSKKNDGGSETAYYLSADMIGSTGKTGVVAALAGVPGAVPEPATWAMMILGLGAIGGAMRRRAIAGQATA